MNYPELPNPFKDKNDLSNAIQHIDRLKKDLPVVKKDVTKPKSQKVQKLKFTIKKDFPALVESNPKRKKRIRKKKRNQGKLIKRFDCELINVSEKIKEICEKKNIVYNCLNKKMFIPLAITKKKKLSRIKKAVNAAKEIAECQQQLIEKELNEDSNYIKSRDQQITKQCPNLLTSRIRQNFNNTEAVKQGYNNDISIREYVDNTLDPKFDEQILKLVNRLTFAYMLRKAQAPLKAKKRVVSGFNEVIKSLNFMQKNK